MLKDSEITSVFVLAAEEQISHRDICDWVCDFVIEFVIEYCENLKIF